MSETPTHTRILPAATLVLVLVLGGFATYLGYSASRDARLATEKLATLEARIQEQQAALARATAELDTLRQQLQQDSTAAELQRLAERVQSIMQKVVSVEGITRALAPLQEKLGNIDLNDALTQIAALGSITNVTSRVAEVQEQIESLSQRNDELVRYIDQRVRSLRSLTERILPANTPPPASSPSSRNPDDTRTPPDSGVYQIAPGDTLETIANQLGVSLRELMQVNPDTDPKRLQIGQRLALPTEQ